MASASTKRRPQVEEAPSLEARVVHWFQQHQRILTGAIAALAVVVLVGWWMRVADERKEAAAEQALNGALVRMQLGNYGEAATGFSRVQDRFEGTGAAQQAILMLNELRLIQGQAALAAQDLASYAPEASARFRTKAFMLLGAAREDAGNPLAGAEAYAEAAASAEYDYEAARALLDAGRAYALAGDTTKAIEAYRRITGDYSETAVVLDARLRIVELEEAQRGSSSS